MRVVTLNLNGIRSAFAKGFPVWLARQRADVVCLQEIKAKAADMTARMLNPSGRYGYFHYAEKKGYSGVGIYARRQPDQVIEGLGIKDIDAEGRYIELIFGKLSVVSVYLPSGSSGEHRQAAKFRFMKRFYPHLAKLAKSGRGVILCGDWNIAHKEIDLKNWKSNQKNSGFLPEERAWLTRVLDDLGWVDVRHEGGVAWRGRPSSWIPTSHSQRRRISRSISTEASLYPFPPFGSPSKLMGCPQASEMG